LPPTTSSNIPHTVGDVSKLSEYVTCASATLDQSAHAAVPKAIDRAGPLRMRRLCADLAWKSIHEKFQKERCVESAGLDRQVAGVVPQIDDLSPRIPDLNVPTTDRDLDVTGSFAR